MFIVHCVLNGQELICTDIYGHLNIFFPGQDPSPPKGTQVVFDLIEKKKKNFKPDEWGASLVEKDGKYMKIQVIIFVLP